MEFTFNIFNLIELLLILASVLGAYYKIDKRQVLLELRQATLEGELRRIDSSVDRKLTIIDKKLDNLSEAVAMIKGQQKT